MGRTRYAHSEQIPLRKLPGSALRAVLSEGYGASDLRRDVLAADDPDNQALGLLDAAVQSVNRCGVKLRTTQTASPLELVRAIRRINVRRHVPDKVFPFRWKPPAVES